MKKETSLKTALNILLPAAVLLVIAVFLVFCRSRFQTEFPVLSPEDGILDVRKVDFSKEVYHLRNSWDYYPGVLYEPQDFRDPDIAASKKNEAPLDIVKGTWRLRILAQPETYYSLCSFSIDYSTRVFVNGKEERNIGFVSDDPDAAVPKVRYMTLPLYSGKAGEIEIVYQYANYVHNEGGFIQNTLISTPENIDEYQRGLTLYSLLISSGLIFLMFFFLLNASFQKRPEYAALALCCLVIALRNQFFFAEHLLVPTYDFYIEYRLLTLDVSWIPASALFLIAAFFPKAVGKKAIYALSGAFLILSILHFTVSTKELANLSRICYYICVPFLVWIGIRLIRYFRHTYRPDRDDLLVLAAVVFYLVILIREGIRTGSNSMVNHFGLTPMAMVITTLLIAAAINHRIQRQVLKLKEAEQRNVLLGQANEMNRDFLRTIAHELKTPLTVISGYAQLINRQMEMSTGLEKTPQRLRTIQSEADRLGEMVTQLMDYTYGQQRETKMGAVDVSELLRSAESVLLPICAKRQNTLVVRNDCQSMIHGDYELLLQVLINLIVNASRHTEAGMITVAAAESGQFVAFTVTDTGGGIAKDAVSHIFEKGFTTGNGRGLGLAICRETVELHGGMLEMVSTGTDGTAFRFKVPKEET